MHCFGKSYCKTFPAIFRLSFMKPELKMLLAPGRVAFKLELDYESNRPSHIRADIPHTSSVIDYFTGSTAF